MASVVRLSGTASPNFRLDFANSLIYILHFALIYLPSDLDLMF